MNKVPMGDVWGGLSASALVLPQAMAFGITLWSPYTQDPAAAAMSGLVAAACLCVVSGLFRGTSGLVAAPTGPTLVLLAGAIAALSARGLKGDDLIAATLLTAVFVKQVVTFIDYAALRLSLFSSSKSSPGLSSTCA